jgi:uncharacterized membrane protein YfcA
VSCLVLYDIYFFYCLQFRGVIPVFLKEQYLGLIALGFGVGAYGTLIGAGGGFVLMPILLLLYPRESPEILTAISLAVVFFNALSGSESYAHMKRIDYKSGLMFAAATIPGAVIGALNTGYVARQLFDTIFGIIVIAIAVFLFLKPASEFKRETKQYKEFHGRFRITRHLIEADGASYTYTYNPIVGIALSFLVGYLSSFLGIGGGIIHVPALVFLLNFPVHIATATSHFILAIMALTGTIVHIWTGTFSHGVHRTIALAIGVVLGAQIGAQLSNHLRGKWIMRSLALALLLLGVRILIAAFQS